MTPAAQLELEAAEIRDAVAAGEYARAQRLWMAHASHVQESLTKDSAGAALVERTRALIDWSRQVILCARTRAQDDLYGLEVRRTYSGEQRRGQGHTVQLIG